MATHPDKSERANSPRPSREHLTRRSAIFVILAALLSAPLVFRFLAGRRRITQQFVVSGPFGVLQHNIMNDRGAEVASKVDLVSPQAFEVRKIHGGLATVVTYFYFEGEPNKDRHVRLTVDLLDKLGKSLGHKSVVCSDARPHSDSPIHLGSTIYRLSPVNVEVLRIQVPEGLGIDDIDSVRIAFSES